MIQLLDRALAGLVGIVTTLPPTHTHPFNYGEALLDFTLGPKGGVIWTVPGDGLLRLHPERHTLSSETG